MREIKFHGKCLFDGEWVEGSLVKHDDTSWIVIFDEEGNEVWIEVDSDTVGQNTGLKDKKGKEIYEGDILRIEMDTCLVDFQNGMFTFKEVGYETDVVFPLHKIIDRYEVIGNIHENPELLE